MTKQGKFDTTFKANRSETVQGALTAGAEVASRVQLLVQGAIAGNVVVNHGGILNVQGSFNGDILRNDGVILIAGTTSRDPSAIPGKVAVAVGSLVWTRSGQMYLGRDGLLHQVTDGLELTCDGSDFYYFDKSDGAYRRLKS